MGTRSRTRATTRGGGLLEPPENGDDNEMLWRQNLTEAVRDLVGAVADLRGFMSGAIETRKATDERLTRLENAGVGTRGWIVIAIAALSFLATASCGILQLAYQAYVHLGR